MNLKDYQKNLSSDGGVIPRLRRLAVMLRAVTEEAKCLGYSLEEIANIDMERRN